LKDGGPVLSLNERIVGVFEVHLSNGVVVAVVDETNDDSGERNRDRLVKKSQNIGG
jgi:hypothetical protein